MTDTNNSETTNSDTTNSDSGNNSNATLAKTKTKLKNVREETETKKAYIAITGLFVISEAGVLSSTIPIPIVVGLYMTALSVDAWG
jgi:hypothetical protein